MHADVSQTAITRLVAARWAPRDRRTTAARPAHPLTTIRQQAGRPMIIKIRCSERRVGTNM